MLKYWRTLSQQAHIMLNYLINMLTIHKLVISVKLRLCQKKKSAVAQWGAGLVGLIIVEDSHNEGSRVTGVKHKALGILTYPIHMQQHVGLASICSPTGILPPVGQCVNHICPLNNPETHFKLRKKPHVNGPVCDAHLK